jgi:transcriptional regulator GlxA family with amidase domain
VSEAWTARAHTTPAKYVEHLRVEVARRRLEETQHSLKRIAGECGFGNTKSMRGVFRRAQQDPSTLFFFPGWNKTNSP